MNYSFSDLDSIIQLSKDSDTLGFDLSTGQTWIYPTNYQVRDYQFNITQAALHNNTLVSLPTGLGKTFIAAVVMYNFYRWYPMGKIIFMAPTRPLVKQQQDACYNIMAIPPDATAEMTGNKIKANRVKIWKEKLVFFITPQILQNDIDVVLDLAQQIKCIVIDEAHKALGKHANCEAMKKIHKINKYFRVLALSATPGSNFNSVKDVITNLLISHIEVRTNESKDVVPYVFNRKLETFVIPITGELLNVKNKYILILDKYTRPLLQFNIFSGNCANLSKGRIVLTMKEFKEKGRHHPKYGYILKSLNLCVTLYHGYELLIRHGLRGFLVFFDGTISKPLMNSINELHEILNDVRNYLGPLEEIEMLPDGTIPEIEGPVVYSHPKFKKLNEVLIEHFKKIEDGDTRVMVFCEYRESVMEIYQMLLRQRPLVKPRVFLGQGAISQAKQIQAVKQFRSGVCNTLISTCIGEEGLDVGEVDLIVCFDISSKSPIRMVQRMGRTGRKRDGRVVVLVTEGKEQQLLSECLVQKNNMNTILESQPIKQYLYNNNPKMIPDNIKPQCNKMFITIKETEKPKKKEDPKKKTKTSKNTLKEMFDTISSQSSSKKLDEDPSIGGNKSHKSPVKASRGSKKNPSISTNQMDLRSMFSKISNTQSSQEPCDSKMEECSELNTLVCKIKSYLNTTITNKSRCKICDIFNNKNICTTTNKTITTKWTKPNLSILDSITSESLIKFSESIAPTNYTFNESKDSNNKNDSLQYFNLESSSDIFSDDSTEPQEYKVEDPIIFNQSIGIFESSNIYHTPAKINNKELDKTKNSTVCEIEDGSTTNKNKDIFDEENDLIVGSDSDNTSPVLCTQRFVDYKQKIQRKLFSQQNTDTPKINSNVLTNEKTGFINNMSTPKNSGDTKKNNMDFWDETVFEVCDSDESLFEDEKLEPDKNILPKSAEQTETTEKIQEDSDSDATIIYSFNTDQIFEDIEKDDLTFENKEFVKPVSTNINNKSVCNKTIDSSLLSVTQAIELLNDSKFKSLDNSVNSLKNPEINNQSLNKNLVDSAEIPTENNSKKNGDIDDLEITAIFEDFNDESEEEFSLLSFSQNRKRKFIQNKNITSENNIKSARTTIDTDKVETILENTKDNSNILNDLKDSDNDFDKEQSLLTFTQNMKKLRNKKFKLSTLKNTVNKCNESVNKSFTQTSPVKLPPKKVANNINKPIILSDSDDDFEKRPAVKPISKLITPVKKLERVSSVPNERTNKNTRKTRSQSYPTRKKRIATKKNPACAFIDDEAEVENDEHYISDSHSDKESDEELLNNSFVSFTQNVLDQTDMRAKYLQSIRSPKFIPGAFKMPHRPPPQVYENVFSQIENCENDTYMNDSFCVGNDQTLSQREGMSYLEVIENQLENENKENKTRKRKRIITHSDSD